jgi:ATP-binding cassette subfamily C protein
MTATARSKVMNNFLPSDWRVTAGYIGLMLVLTLFLRSGSLIFNVLQARLFARLSKRY